jgi:predicted PurR-regulated permease PerM
MIAPSRMRGILAPGGASRESAPCLVWLDARSEIDLEVIEVVDRVVPPGTRGRRLLAWGVGAWTGVGIAVVLGLVGLVLAQISAIFPFLAVAALVVFALNPFVKLLARLGLHRRLAATIVFAASALAVPPLLALVVQTVVDQGRSLLNEAPGLIGKGGVFTKFRASDNSVLHDIGAGALRYLHHHHVGTKVILDRLGNAAVQLTHVGLILVFGGIIGYVVLLSLPEIGRGSIAMVPQARRRQVTEFFAEVGRLASGYVRARLIVSAVVGVVATIGLWAIGMPFWLVLGLLVGVANLIPVLGSWIGGIPVILVALLTKPPSFLFAAGAVMIGAHLIDGWILSPIVFKGTLDLHPVVTLLAVIVGAEILGVWGVLLGVPIAGLIQYVAGRWLAPYRHPVEIGPEPAPNG